MVVAAYRGDHPHHDGVRAWFGNATAGGGSFGVPAFVWATFLRLVTNRRVFTVPATRDEAFSFIEEVRAHPLHVDINPGSRHLDVLRSCCDDADALGDLVPDAVLAAVAVENACVVVTLDRDFARFQMVDHVRPSADEA